MLQLGSTWLLATVFVLADVLPIPSCGCDSYDSTFRKVRGRATITRIEAASHSRPPSCDDTMLVYFDFLENGGPAGSPHDDTNQELGPSARRTLTRAFVERNGITVGRAYASTKRIYARNEVRYTFSNLDLEGNDDDGDCAQAR